MNILICSPCLLVHASSSTEVVHLHALCREVRWGVVLWEIKTALSASTRLSIRPCQLITETFLYPLWALNRFQVFCISGDLLEGSLKARATPFRSKSRNTHTVLHQKSMLIDGRVTMTPSEMVFYVLLSQSSFRFSFWTYFSETLTFSMKLIEYSFSKMFTIIDNVRKFKLDLYSQL